MFEVCALLKIVLALFLGGFLGWQRELAGKAAGPRTHGLVCAGATLFTILSIYGFGSGADGSRIASGIVTGIGFLGAGMIMKKDDNSVSGLTTAAGLWAVSAIGMAVGVGMHLIAIFSTIIIFIALMINDDRLARHDK